MITFLICLIISVLLAFGMAVTLVEKGRQWPVRRYRLLIARWVHNHIHYKAAQLLYCATCTSFWMALIADIVLCIVSGGLYFFWPFSGFIVVGFTYFVFEFLNAVDNDIYIGDNSDEKEDRD